MTEVAQKYLGNIKQNLKLIEQVNQAKKANKYLEVLLQESDRAKGRILTKSVSGVSIGIIKNRELRLKSGDVLETEAGNLLVIKVQEEKTMVLSFTFTATNEQVLELVKLGHLLGNNHYPIKIQDNKIYVRLVTNPKVIEKNLKQLNIDGLKIEYTNQSIDYEQQEFLHHH